MSGAPENRKGPRKREWPAILFGFAGWALFLGVAVGSFLRRRKTPALIQRTLPPQIGGSSQRTRVPTRPERVLHPEEIKPESGEVRSGLIFSIVFGWFVFVFIGLAVLMRVNDATPRLPPPPAEKSFPAPRLDTLPNALLAPYLATQRRRLTNSAIPITRAMMEIAKRPDPYAPIAAGEDSSGH